MHPLLTSHRATAIKLPLWISPISIYFCEHKKGLKYQHHLLIDSILDKRTTSSYKELWFRLGNISWCSVACKFSDVSYNIIIVGAT